MMAHDDESRRPFPRMPRWRATIPLSRVLFSLVLCALLGTNVISGWLLRRRMLPPWRDRRLPR